jgi:hypothetical protein
MLETATGAIRRTLILATLVAPAAPGEGYSRLLSRSLRVLAFDLRFSKCDIHEINAILSDFEETLRQLGQTIRAPIDKLLEIPEADTKAWTIDFKKWVGVLEELDPKPFPEADMPAHESRWLQFLLSRFRTGKSVFIPDFNDLLLL